MLHHCIENGKEFARAGDERDFRSFAFNSQPVGLGQLPDGFGEVSDLAGIDHYDGELSTAQSPLTLRNTHTSKLTYKVTDRCSPPGAPVTK